MKVRDLKIDIFKGLLVIGMGYCHLLQFFADLGSNSTAEHITWYINAVTFSGFVFAFGYTSEMAYFSKSFRDVGLKMFKAFFRLLMAYYISGISYRIFADHQALSGKLVKNILLLNDIPGWSEFIISFALFILVAMVLFAPIKHLIDHKWILLPVVCLLLSATCLPYKNITITQLGLMIGTTRFASFPVLQYMPFFFLGMSVKRYSIRQNMKVGFKALCLSGIGLLWIFLHDMQLPDRFPPSLFWIVLPAIALYAYYLISAWIESQRIPSKYLVILGRNSMVYLLLSNILIFALKGVRAIPKLDSLTGFLANLLMLMILTYIIGMVRPAEAGTISESVREQSYLNAKKPYRSDGDAVDSIEKLERGSV